MSDNGWPGKPGVPLNPEQNRRHWLSLLGGEDNAEAMKWLGLEIGWDDTDWSTEDFGLHARYLGPCLTPAEVDALQTENARMQSRVAKLKEEKKIMADLLVVIGDTINGAVRTIVQETLKARAALAKGEGDE